MWYKQPSWLPASLYIDWQLGDITEGVCPAAGWGWGVFMWWGVINEDWNVERKQTRPRRHLSFTKPAQLTLFFNPSPPLLTTTTPLDYVTHWHTCRLLRPLRTHFFFILDMFFFFPAKCGAGGLSSSCLRFSIFQIWPLTSSNLLTLTNPTIVSSSVRVHIHLVWHWDSPGSEESLMLTDPTLPSFIPLLIIMGLHLPPLFPSVSCDEEAGGIIE